MFDPNTPDRKNSELETLRTAFDEAIRRATEGLKRMSTTARILRDAGCMQLAEEFAPNGSLELLLSVADGEITPEDALPVFAVILLGTQSTNSPSQTSHTATDPCGE